MTNARRREIFRASPAWTYRRAEPDAVVEIGTVRGQDVGLPPHFHDEDQITFVHSGRRRFRIGGEIITIEAGGCALIHAGAVHRSLDEPEGVDGLNLYLPAGLYESTAMMGEIGCLWRGGILRDAANLMAFIERCCLRGTGGVSRMVGPRRTVTERAERAGLGRERFSRAFTREHGMPPHAFGLIVRLNHARQLLRYGVPIVDAALDAGFADQSHLGRCFRRAFGVTPGRYRAG